MNEAKALSVLVDSYIRKLIKNNFLNIIQIQVEAITDSRLTN